MKLNQITKSISLALLTSTAAYSAEFLVITNGDKGGGAPNEISNGVFEVDTLRSAIELADDETAFPGADTIGFDARIFNQQQAEINVNLAGDNFDLGALGGISYSAFGINSEITVAGPTNATLRLVAGDLRHFQVNEGGQLNISHVTLDDGFAPTNLSGIGGSIYVRRNGVLNLSDTTLSNNQASSGGAVFVGPLFFISPGIENVTSTITKARFIANKTRGVGGGRGGAVFHSGAADELGLVISESTFSENSSTGDGGAIFAAGKLMIDSSTIHNNQAGTSSSDANGGGIGVRSNVTITLNNSTITNNKASREGGGIDIRTTVGKGINKITNSTITNNQSLFAEAPSAFKHKLGNGEIEFDSSGGGIAAYGYVDNDNLVIHNSIIVGNTETTAMLADDVAAILQPDSSHNFIGAGDSVFAITDGVNGNQIGTRDVPIDAQLQPLADNGGATLTQLPVTGSPVIDAGSDALCETTDQRGFIRPFDGDGNGITTCDIGAVELGAVTDLIFKDGFDELICEFSLTANKSAIRGCR